MALLKLGEKKILWNPNCGNAIAEIGEKKIAIVAIALPKMGEGERGSLIYGRVKKNKKCHVHNIFTTFSQ